MNFSRERCEPLDEKPPLLQDRCAILHDLFIPRIQTKVPIGSLTHLLQQPVSMLKRLLIIGKIEAVFRTDLRNLQVEKTPALGRIAGYQRQIQWPEEDDVEV